MTRRRYVLPKPQDRRRLPNALQRPEVHNELLNALTARRIALNLTLPMLGKRTGFATNTVSRVLNGHPANYETIVAIANALGYDLTLSPRN